MNNDIYNMDLLQFLPGALKHDEKMVALARGLADELLGVSGHIRDVLIYSRIDELPEDLLDILAFDMHVDWYDYNYPIEAKKNIIKDSVKVHKKMGTKYAIERAIQAIYKDSRIEEWFQYDGKPYHFKLILNVDNKHQNIDFDKIIQEINLYKRLSAHLESINLERKRNTVIKVGAMKEIHLEIEIMANPFQKKIIKKQKVTVSSSVINHVSVIICTQKRMED